MRPIVLLLLSLLLTLAPAAGAAESGLITHQGTLSSPAVAVAHGADGAVWHVTADGRVGRTTIFGVTTEWPLGAGGAEPVDIAAGWDGTLWVAARDGTVWGVSPAGLTVPFATLGAGTPTAIAIGWDGRPWVAVADTQGTRDAIARVAEDTSVELFQTGSRRDPSDLAPGWDGALWFTEPGSPGRVGRVGIDGAVTDLEADFARNSGPAGIAPGAGQALWFTQSRGSGAIARIGAGGAVTEFRSSLLGGGRPGAIAAGADGAMYFTLKDAIGRITPSGVVTTYPTGRAEPVALAATPDGAVWFADANAATLGRLGASRPAPVQLGVAVQVTPKRGIVRVKPRGAKRFRALDTTTTVPVGSLVDTRRGRVRLISAIGRGGSVQSGRFHGGLFSVRQRPSGLVQLALRGRLECGRATGSLATTSRKRRKRRRLWGNDLGGAFSTLGRDSVTTVRGTKWLTEDRCGGTLTRVERGSVVVRDRRTGERVVLRAGERYFARHR